MNDRQLEQTFDTTWQHQRDENIQNVVDKAFVEVCHEVAGAYADASNRQEWLQWGSTTYGWTEQHLYQMKNVSEMVASSSISNLKISKLGKKVLTMIAAPSVSEETRAVVVEAAQEKTVTVTEARKLMNDARNKGREEGAAQQVAIDLKTFDANEAKSKKAIQEASTKGYEHLQKKIEEQKAEIQRLKNQPVTQPRQDDIAEAERRLQDLHNNIAQLTLQEKGENILARNARRNIEASVAGLEKAMHSFYTQLKGIDAQELEAHDVALLQSIEHTWSDVQQAINQKRPSTHHLYSELDMSLDGIEAERFPS